MPVWFEPPAALRAALEREVTRPYAASPTSARPPLTDPGRSAPAPGSSVTERARSLSQRYLADRPAESAILSDPTDVAAYATARMPATFAAARFALEELVRAEPSLAPTTLLDLGAGTGAATWAAWDAFDSLEAVELRDYSAPALDLAARLLASTDLAVTATLGDAGVPVASQHLEVEPSAALGSGGVASSHPVSATGPAHDLAICAYVLSELAPDQRREVVATAIDQAASAVVVIEPGTPAGFERILAVRSQLLAAGWRLAAPCPHELPCPVAARPGDWCHAAVRLQRTHEHRAAKGGTRDFEDEKLAWIAALPPEPRTPLSPDPTGPTGPTSTVRPARVLRHPRVNPGHVRLELCTPEGELTEQVVSKREGATYRRARKVEWGEAWAQDHPPVPSA